VFYDYPAKVKIANGSRKRNEVKRPDHPAFDPVTARCSVPGCHWEPTILTLAACTIRILEIQNHAKILQIAFGFDTLILKFGLF